MYKYAYSTIIKCIIIVGALLLSGCSSLLIATLNHRDLTTVSVDGKNMYILGLLNSQTKDILVNSLNNNPEVTTLIFTANPGSIDDETVFSLGQYIRNNGLNTHLLNDSVIASGAVDLFLAGNSRSMEKGAQLGVHSWSDGRAEATEYPRDDPAHHANAGFIAEMLGDDLFYWFTITAAPADDIYWMNQQEIERFGILTTTVQEPGFDPTPFGQDFLEMRDEILDL